MGLRPKLARDGLMPQHAAKMLGIFSTGRKLFSHRTFMISCSSYVNAERQAISFYSNTAEFHEKLERNSSLKTADSFLEPIWYPRHGQENLDFFKRDKRVPLFLRSGSKQDTDIYLW